MESNFILDYILLINKIFPVHISQYANAAAYITIMYIP